MDYFVYQKFCLYVQLLNEILTEIYSCIIFTCTGKYALRNPYPKLMQVSKYVYIPIGIMGGGEEDARL